MPPILPLANSLAIAEGRYYPLLVCSVADHRVTGVEKMDVDHAETSYLRQHQWFRQYLARYS